VSESDKPDLARAWLRAEKLADDEADRLAKMSDEDFEREMSALPEPERVPTVEELLARAAARASKRGASGVQAGGAKVKARPLQPRRPRWVALLAAAAIGGLVVAVVMYLREPPVAQPRPDEDSGGQGEATPGERAAKLRRRSSMRCTQIPGRGSRPTRSRAASVAGLRLVWRASRTCGSASPSGSSFFASSSLFSRNERRPCVAEHSVRLPRAPGGCAGSSHRRKVAHPSGGARDSHAGLRLTMTRGDGRIRVASRGDREQRRTGLRPPRSPSVWRGRRAIARAIVVVASRERPVTVPLVIVVMVVAILVATEVHRVQHRADDTCIDVVKDP
jgi:hypothetical protein